MLDTSGSTLCGKFGGRYRWAMVNWMVKGMLMGRSRLGVLENFVDGIFEEENVGQGRRDGWGPNSRKYLI